MSEDRSESSDVRMSGRARTGANPAMSEDKA